MQICLVYTLWFEISPCDQNGGCRANLICGTQNTEKRLFKTVRCLDNTQALLWTVLIEVISSVETTSIANLIFILFYTSYQYTGLADLSQEASEKCLFAIWVKLPF